MHQWNEYLLFNSECAVKHSRLNVYKILAMCSNTYATGFGTIGLNVASEVFYFFPTSRLHGALECRPPNLEAVAQAISALQHFSIFV